MRRQAKISSERSLARASAFSADDAAITYDPATLGHNGGPTFSDAEIVSEVIARGLLSIVAARLPLSKAPDAPPSPSPQPLAISVTAARELIGVGNTTMWGLIKSGQVDVIRPCRRTLVLVVSLHAYISRLTASARQSKQEAIQSGGGNAPPSSPRDPP